MCGRYTLAIDKSTIEHRFDAKFYIAEPSYDWSTTFNAGPSQMLPIILKPASPLRYAREPTEFDSAEKNPVNLAILTTKANEAVAHIHDRMPVILQLGREKSWLPPNPTGMLMFPRIPAELLTSYPVTPKMNREAIAPLEPTIMEACPSTLKKKMIMFELNRVTNNLCFQIIDCRLGVERQRLKALLRHQQKGRHACRFRRSSENAQLHVQLAPRQSGFSCTRYLSAEAPRAATLNAVDRALIGSASRDELDMVRAPVCTTYYIAAMMHSIISIAPALRCSPQVLVAG